MITGFSLATFSLTFFLIAAVGFIIVRVRRVRATKEARAKVFNGPWIDARDLVAGWENENQKYKQLDDSGCYILLVFDHEVKDGNYTDYKDVFVGKANKACEGAYSHLSGEGIEEIAQDFQDESRFVYVQIRAYEADVLERRERSLVKVMNARKSYNGMDNAELRLRLTRS